MLLAITILISIFISIIFLIYLYALKFKSSSRFMQAQDKIFFEIDFKTNKIRLTNSPFNQRYYKRLFPVKVIRNKEQQSWNDISVLTNSFIETTGESAFRSAFNKIKSGEENATEIFNIENFFEDKEELVIQFTIHLTKRLGNQYTSLLIKWESVNNIIDESLDIPEISESALVSMPYSNFGFVAFNTNDVRKASTKFINSYSKIAIISKNNINFFIKRKVVVLVVNEKTHAKVKKEIKKIKNILNTKGVSLSMNHFYNSSAVLEAKNVHTPKKLARVFALLEYLLWLSYTNKIGFITFKSKHFSDIESRKFIDASFEFRSSIKSGNFSAKTISVKTRSNKRHIMDYALPVVTSIKNDLQNKITNNIVLKRNMIDAFASTQSYKKGRNAIMFDVNDYWIVQNYEKMINKKVIYIINTTHFDVEESLVNSVKILKEKGFYFALRLKIFSENISTLIKKIEPQFVIFDSILSNNPYDPDTYTHILATNNIAKELGIKIIFENPIDYYDHIREKQIGLKYYYSTENKKS